SKFPKMTRCLNLVAIVAVATTTFLSTFAHGIKVELTDKDGVIHEIEVADRVCKQIPGGIIAVSGKADADTCEIYLVSDCTPTSEDYRSFGGRGTGVNFREVTANSIWCDEKRENHS
ncbi:hypothetical protein DFQ26_005652, partial [Actinomortierella ambigua]